MAGKRRRRTILLSLERLETRQAPSSTPWLSESFDTTPAGSLPANWSQGSSDPSGAFGVASSPSFSSPNSLVVNADMSRDVAQAWYSPVADADVQVSAEVLVNSLIPAQILARGNNLGTATSTFYALEITRGLELDLIRVVNGVTTPLAQLNSGVWFSDQWAQLTLSINGTSLQAQVYRPDTKAYLSTAGQWQTAQAWALTVTDSAITGKGQVGLGRPASYTGSVAFDDFTADTLDTTPPTTGAPLTTSETFDSTAAGAMPTGWAQWSSDGSTAFAIAPGLALSTPNGLAATAGTSRLSAQAWQITPQPADLQVTSAVYLDSLIPAQVLARGSGLGTATPSFYAVAVSRGLEVDLQRTVNGVTTKLASMLSAAWFSDKWVRVTLSVTGSKLQAQVLRVDTGQYLNAAGQWQSSPAWCLTASDSTITGGGLVGVGRPASYVGSLTFDDFAVTVTATSTNEAFDTTPVGSVPANWSQWSSESSSAFAVSSSQALSAPNGLAVTASTSQVAAQAWDNAPQPADLQVTAAVDLNSVIPAEVFARGSGLGTATPSFYALAISRGLEVDLVRSQNGVPTTLASLTSANWFSDQWVRVTIAVTGTTLQAQVFRTDTAQYLTSAGQWQGTPAWALTASDSTLSGSGLVGLARPSSYVGTITFDDFSATPAATAKLPPVVDILTPSAGATLSGMTSVSASATGTGAITRVAFYVDGILHANVTTAPYQWSFDTSTASNGSHTIMVKAYDLMGDAGQSSVNFSTSNSNALFEPTIPQHLPHIRVMELDYGNSLGSLEDQLLQGGVDLVVTGGPLADQVHAVAPNTPQLVYTNITNLYGSLLTNWLDYANANGPNPEGAFYHVTQATPFSGDSPSSQPVKWFWAVSRTGKIATDLTGQANGSEAGGVAFGAAGEAVNVGYPEPFNEINVNLASPAASGWSAVVEYPSAVDAAGNPTAWSSMTVKSNSTSGLTQSGQITFDPPANWKMAAVNGSALLYYVRFRTMTSGTAPVVATILGNDYLNATGTDSGTIPAFDMSADVNHDGYLNDTEYANRTPGMNARFLYQSRAFYGNYGQMRFATNPSDPGFRAWAVQYAVSFLSSQPYASGLFVDNSGGNFDVNAPGLVESSTSYSTDYGSLLRAIGQAIAPRWIMANSAGGGTAADAVVRNVAAYFEEFALRPLASTYQQFDDLAAEVAERAALTVPSPYAVLDSSPSGGSPSDPRTQLATLASYYLLADPNRTFLDFYGGYAPATPWDQHWAPAAGYDIGQPLDTWSLFASGADPENASLAYQVYQRNYTSALVLYKPLSTNANGATAGTLDDASATTFQLNGTYRPLSANGLLGAPITQITLRNGEGAILIKSNATLPAIYSPSGVTLAPRKGTSNPSPALN
jgi:Bacterial Ig domain